MKKVFLVIVISIFTLASCSSEDSSDNVVVEQTSIIGKWKTVSATENGKQVILSSCDLYGYSEFLENNNCVLVQGENTSAGQCKQITSYASYIFTGNTLTYKTEMYESRSHITELTATSFKISTYFTKDQNGVEEIPVSEQRTYTVEKIK